MFTSMQRSINNTLTLNTSPFSLFTVSLVLRMNKLFVSTTSKDSSCYDLWENKWKSRTDFLIVHKLIEEYLARG